MGGELELGGRLICFGAAPRPQLWGTAWCLSGPRCPKRWLLECGALMRAGVVWGAVLGLGGRLELEGAVIFFGAAPRAPLFGDGVVLVGASMP